jgi:hypothetical protein
MRNLFRQVKYAGQGVGMRSVLDMHNRSCTNNIRSEIYYCLGNKRLVVSFTDLADIKTRIIGGSDKIWLGIKQKGII